MSVSSPKDPRAPRGVARLKKARCFLHSEVVKDFDSNDIDNASAVGAVGVR